MFKLGDQSASKKNNIQFQFFFKNESNKKIVSESWEIASVAILKILHGS